MAVPTEEKHELTGPWYRGAGSRPYPTRQHAHHDVLRWVRQELRKAFLRMALQVKLPGGLNARATSRNEPTTAGLLQSDVVIGGGVSSRRLRVAGGLR